MRDHSIPALPRPPSPPMDRPDPASRQPHRADPPGRGLPRASAAGRGRVPMPPTENSGYEQILAARSAVRTRVHQAGLVGGHGPSEPMAPFPAAAGRTLPKPWPARRRGRTRALVASGLVAAPLCALLAFAWAVEPRPSAAPARAPSSSGAATPTTAGLPTAARTYAGDDDLAALIGEHLPPPRADGARPAAVETHASFAPPLAAGAWGRASAATAGEAAAPSRVADAGTEPLWDSVPPLAVPSGFDAGAATPSAGHPPASPAPDVAEAEASSDQAADEMARVFASWGEDVLAPSADAGSGPPAPWAASAAQGAGPAGDAAPAESPSAEAAFGIASPLLSPVPDGDAAEHAVRDEAAPPAHVAGLSDAEPAAGDGHAPAPPVAAARGDSHGTAEARRVAAARPGPAATVSEATPPAGGVSVPESASGPSRKADTNGSAGASGARPVELAVAAGRLPPALPPVGGAAPAKLRPDGPPPLPPVSRVAARDAAPPADARCRAIVMKAQLGEETNNAERSLLRSGCGTRR